jgi:hypothetical protein
MTPVFLSGAARWLLMLHAVLGLAAVGSSVHLALGAVRVWQGKAPSMSRAQQHSLLVACLLSAALLVGLVLYPHYRVNVRGYVLDATAPWASNLFDIKEHLALLAFPLSLALWALRRQVRPGGPFAAFFAACAVSQASLLTFTAAAGLLITSVKGV